MKPGLVARAYNSSYSGSRGRMVTSSRPAWAKLDRISKLNANKRAEGIAQVLESLPNIPEVLDSKKSFTTNYLDSKIITNLYSKIEFHIPVVLKDKYIIIPKTLNWNDKLLKIYFLCLWQ
jgi:hypothetical protein